MDSVCVMKTTDEEVVVPEGMLSFRESFGECRRVFYNPKLFTVEKDEVGSYLYYRGTASEFELPIGASTIYKMFSKYAAIPREVDLTGVVNADYAFIENSSSLKIDLSEWNAPDVKSMNHVFERALAASIVLFKAPVVEEMQFAFQQCNYLKEVIIDFGKDYGLKDLRGLVQQCISLVRVNLSVLADVYPCLDEAFVQCINLKTVDLSKFYFSESEGADATKLGAEGLDVAFMINQPAEFMFENSGLKYEVVSD